MTIGGPGLSRDALPPEALLPGDAGYDAARISFNGLLDRRPAAIVPCTTTAEVQAAVRAARSADLPIAVRGGGHSVAGHGIADDALVVSLAGMRQVTVDPAQRTADAGGGALWEDVDGATTAHGLAVPGGTFVDTGIGGLTLGGGLGWLMPLAGLTCDNLAAAEVVTADGSVATAGEGGDPELLWALRGGGGNFGVVTRFTYRLIPIGPIFGGRLLYPASAAAEVLARVERLIAENPGLAPELVGFHGQTVFHAPRRRLTVQIGDGPALARRLRLPVVCDFRAADVAAGGEGAPFVPAYHRALVRAAGLTGDTVVVNIGGVANLTRLAADGAIAAGDTGPGNALLDDFVRARTGRPMDEGGALSGRGTVDRAVLAALMANPFFGLPMPKSLDRDAFSSGAVARRSTEDGAATLAAFTAATIAKGIAVAGGADTIVVAGGGAHNPTILGMLEDAAGTPVLKAADLGWSGDFVEAEAFAYLAARSLAGLPLSYPETTGVPRPMPGGVLVRPA